MVDSAYDAYARRMGISSITLMVFALLNEERVYTQKEICERLDLPKQLVNSMVKSLWEKKYVKLVEATDRRNKEIRVTAAGRAYLAKILDPLDAAETAALAAFSPEETEIHAAAMARFAEAFAKELGKHKCISE
jgi:DNA-binding MarR family transcriptional regulator